MWKHLCRVVALFVTIFLLVAGEGLALTLDRNPERWGFGVDAGLWGATVDGNVRPAFGANLDYYVDRAFSVGPMVLFSTGKDLTEFAMAGVVRYHWRTPIGNIVPFTGLGFVRADWKDRSSTSHYVPIGLSFEYQLTKKLALSTTGIFNLHYLFAPTQDEKSATLLFGLRYGGPTVRMKRWSPDF